MDKNPDVHFSKIRFHLPEHNKAKPWKRRRSSIQTFAPSRVSCVRMHTIHRLSFFQKNLCLSGIIKTQSVISKALLQLLGFLCCLTTASKKHTLPLTHSITPGLGYFCYTFLCKMNKCSLLGYTFFCVCHSLINCLYLAFFLSSSKHFRKTVYLVLILYLFSTFNPSFLWVNQYIFDYGIFCFTEKCIFTSKSRFGTGK